MSDIKYKQAPVSEVILGVTFKDQVLARNNFFISLTQELLSEYPNYQVNSPLGNDVFNERLVAIPQLNPAVTGPHLNRQWSADKNWLVQFQFNKFFLNWVRDDSKEVGNYPGYSAISKKFKRQLDSLMSKTNSSTQDILYSELTYQDRIVIPPEAKSNLSEIINFKLPSFKKAPSHTDFFTAFNSPIEELGGFLIFNMITMPAQQNDILKIEFIIKGNLSNVSPYEWMDRAHEVHVDIFEEFISKQTLEKWK
jgi:uncharacterized protein (TIGR04255 family)